MVHVHVHHVNMTVFTHTVVNHGATKGSYSTRSIIPIVELRVYIEVRRKGVMVAMTTIRPTLIMIGEKGTGMAVWLNQLH